MVLAEADNDLVSSFEIFLQFYVAFNKCRQSSHPSSIDMNIIKLYGDFQMI